MDKMIAERYMLVSLLGEGGMADVYLAIDTILNREVAIKILRGELSKDPVTLPVSYTHLTLPTICSV